MTPCSGRQPVKKVFLTSGRTGKQAPAVAVSPLAKPRRAPTKPANAKIARKRRKTGGNFCFLRQPHLQSAVTCVQVRSLACKFASLACRLSQHSGGLLTLSTSCAVSSLEESQNLQDFAPLATLSNFRVGEWDFPTQKSSRSRRTRSDFAGFPNRPNRPAFVGLKPWRVFNLPPGTIIARKGFGPLALSDGFLQRKPLLGRWISERLSLCLAPRRHVSIRAAANGACLDWRRRISDLAVLCGGTLKGAARIFPWNTFCAPPFRTPYLDKICRATYTVGTQRKGVFVWCLCL